MIWWPTPRKFLKFGFLKWNLQPSVTALFESKGPLPECYFIVYGGKETYSTIFVYRYHQNCKRFVVFCRVEISESLKMWINSVISLAVFSQLSSSHLSLLDITPTSATKGMQERGQLL